MRIDAYRTQNVFLLLAVVLLAASLFLPCSVSAHGSPPHLLPGWAAMLIPLMFGLGMLFHTPSKLELFHALMLLPFLAALLNLNFVVTGLCPYRRRILPCWLLACTLCGPILAIVSPFVLRGGDRMLAGFYVWLLAHACLVAAVVSARYAHHKTHR